MTYAAPTGNITGIADVLSYFNGTVDNFFIPAILIGIYFIIIIKQIFNQNEVAKSFAAASFVIMITSILFRLIDLVSTQFMVIFIILTGVSIVWMHIENS